MSKTALPLAACFALACRPVEAPPAAPSSSRAPAATGETPVPGPAPGDEPTAPQPEPVDDAAIVEAMLPRALRCGESTSATLTVRNSGTTTWTAASGYKLGAVGDQDDLVAGDVRVWLSETDRVLPGAEFSFEVPLVAPDLGGVHTTDWQMVREGVAWFGEVTAAEVTVTCNRAPDPLPGEQLPLPDMGWLVQEVADENPDLLERSCQDDGGTWEFLDLVVDELRAYDTRWGYNWKRGVVGDPSEDVVDYHWGAGADEGSEEVYILDVIGGHCGPAPQPAWIDVTEATLDGGTIGIWTGRDRF